MSKFYKRTIILLCSVSFLLGLFSQYVSVYYRYDVSNLDVYNALEIDIQRAEMRFNERRELLKNLNLNKITNVDLKNIFNQIKVMAYYADGYKYILLHFSYKILDDTKTELLREETNGESIAVESFFPFKTEKIRKSTRTRYFDNEEDDKWKPKLE